MNKNQLDWLEEYVKKHYTPYGIFMFQNQRDVITSMHEELYCPRNEMNKDYLLSDATGSALGSKLIVKYKKRGTVVYEIKKRDYKNFYFWLKRYYEVLSCIKEGNRKYVKYFRTQGYIIPHEILSNEEKEKLMECGVLKIVEISSRKWYMLGVGDPKSFEDFIE